jgi:hypothetical protein
MKRLRIRSSALVCLIIMSTAHATPVVSYFPKEHLGRFLADTFDLASIRSSLGPRRKPAMRTFADFGMKPSKMTDNVLEYYSPGDWEYELKIIGRRDVNGDGIEDLEACFFDRARNSGTYNVSKGLLITRYSADGYAIALSYSLDDSICENYAR